MTNPTGGRRVHKYLGIGIRIMGLHTQGTQDVSPSLAQAIWCAICEQCFEMRGLHVELEAELQERGSR